MRKPNWVEPALFVLAVLAVGMFIGALVYDAIHPVAAQADAAEQLQLREIPAPKGHPPPREPPIPESVRAERQNIRVRELKDVVYRNVPGGDVLCPVRVVCFTVEGHRFAVIEHGRKSGFSVHEIPAKTTLIDAGPN